VRLIVQKDGRRLKGPAANTKTEARAEWANRHEKPRGANRPSLSTFAKNWKDSQRGSPSTLEQLRIFVSSKIERDPIGEVKVHDLTDSDVRDWLVRQKGEPSTVKRNLGRLKQILKAAGFDSKVSRPHDPGHARRPLTTEERRTIPKLIDQAPDEPTRRAIEIAIGTGLRRSEIIALRHEDRDGRGVWVRRRAIATKGRLDVQPSVKSGRSRRWVPLPPSLEWIGSAKGFVLTDSKEPVSPHVLTKGLKKASKGTALEGMPFAGFHALRRTYLMMLLESGADIVTVAEIGGHDVTMLQNEYLRSREDLKIKAVEGAFGGPNHHPITHEGAC
jgi:integrase